MSEFIDKLRSSDEISNAWDEIDKDQASAGLLIDVIKSEFKDWQPPKELVEVPQIVDDWYTERMIGTFAGVISSYAFNNDLEAVRWVQGNGGIDLLCHMKLESYTVKKEKKYILKHIDLSELSNDDSLYLIHGMYNKYEHTRYSKDVDMSKVEESHFTQSEIDELHAGSYEQIEVLV